MQKLTMNTPAVPAVPLLSRLVPIRLRIFRALALPLKLLPTLTSASTVFPSRWEEWREVVQAQGCWVCSGILTLEECQGDCCFQ